MPLDPTAATPPADHLPLGELGRTFQLEGALRWRLPPALADEAGPGSLLARVVAAAGRLFVTGLGEARVRELRHPLSGAPLLLLEGVRDRTTAQRLVNAGVWLDPGLLAKELADELKETLAAGSEEEAMIGIVVRLGKERVGSVAAADLSGPNALALVELDAGGRCLVPLAAPYVVLTEEPAVVLMDPPEGLLEPQ